MVTFTVNRKSPSTKGLTSLLIFFCQSTSSVNAYGVLKNITFPLSFKLFKPKSRLKEKDVYRTKPQLAVEIINELREIGFKFKIVLADSLYGVQFGEEKMGQAPYTTDNLWPQKITQKEPAPFSKPCLGESGDFIEALNRHKLNFVVAIRSNHGVWMPQGARVRYTRWKKFDRIFTNGDTEVRYIREIVFGKRQDIRYWQITTDKDELPDNSTWFIMTNLLGDITKSVGNTYGLRTWIEYGFKSSLVPGGSLQAWKGRPEGQVKDELGWADYRLTDYGAIEKWWEIVCSAYLMVSLQSEIFQNLETKSGRVNSEKLESKFSQHQWWDKGQGWKNVLNNLRLIIQPYVFFCLIKPWLKVFQIPLLKHGFLHLINIMNSFNAYIPDG